MVAPKQWNDGIVYDYVICLALALFLGLWIVVWAETSWRRQRAGSPSIVRDGRVHVA
jgi:hypothetical protein